MSKYRNSIENMEKQLNQAKKEVLNVLANHKDLSKDDLAYLQARLHRFRRIQLQLNRIRDFRNWMNHVSGDAMTLDEIGKVMGVTRERVRQLEASALKKIKHPSLGQVFREYCKISIAPSRNASEFSEVLVE